MIYHWQSWWSPHVYHIRNDTYLVQMLSQGIICIFLPYHRVQVIKSVPGTISYMHFTCMYFDSHVCVTPKYYMFSYIKSLIKYWIFSNRNQNGKEMKQNCAKSYKICQLTLIFELKRSHQWFVVDNHRVGSTSYCCTSKRQSSHSKVRLSAKMQLFNL